MKLPEPNEEAEKLMKELLLENTDLLKDIAEYAISTGGKRIRGNLVLLSCEAVGGKQRDALYAYGSIELFHYCTLIVDDIIDKGEIRRGNPTIIKKYGLSGTECVNFVFMSAAVEAANKCGKPIVEILTRIAKVLSDGEMKDVLFEQYGRDEPFYNENKFGKITLDDYYDMISKKTAELIKASCEMGAILGEGSKEQIEALKKYGYNLGMAFQLTDDILDIYGDEALFGKKIGKDILEHKLGNIVILLADSEDLYTILLQDNPDVEKAIEIINKTDAKKKAEAITKTYLEKAKDSIKDLPETDAKKILIEVVDLILERQN